MQPIERLALLVSLALAFGATGAKWDEATLAKYLENPKELVPGNKMSFAGIKKEDDRNNVIAYLKTKM